MSGRIVVTGASGFLGRQVLDSLRQANLGVVEGWAFSRAKDSNLRQVNLTDESAVKNAFSDFKPNIVVHCAAERRPDRIAETFEHSQRLNVGSTEQLAQLLASDSAALMVYISTDYVFDGENPPYDVTDEPNPLNQYGELKLLGERKIIKCLPRDSYAILRVPLLYGPIEYVGEGAVDDLLKPMLNPPKKSSDEVLLDNVQQRFPTHTRDVARAVVFLVEKHLQSHGAAGGIFHWSGTKRMTKFEIATVLAEALDLPQKNLKPLVEINDGAKVRRPLNAQLSCTRLIDLGLEVGQWDFDVLVKDLYRSFVTRGQ